MELTPKPLAKLSRDEEKGWLLEDDIRIISFKIKTFQATIDKLIKIAGLQVAKVVLYEVGNEIGRTGLRYSKEEIHSEKDLAKVFDKVLSLRGWGRCLDLEKRKQAGKPVYVFKTVGCPLCHERKAAEPTCHMMRGIVAGWLEEYFGRKAKSSAETSCSSMGDRLCIFEVTFED